MIEANEAIDKDELDAARADNAARQNRWRARKDLELEGLSVAKMLQLKKTRSAALAATIKAAEDTLQNLNPEQRAIYESEVFREGLPDGSSAGLRGICAQMFDIVDGIKNGETIIKNPGFPEVRGDWVAEFLADFLTSWPFAKALVYPKSYSGESSYTMAEFFTSVERWLASSTHDDSNFTLPEPEKRKRGRPRVHPVVVTDPAIVASWSKFQPAQTDRADRSAAAALKRDIEEAALTRPT
jgi:hypothetical protein